MYQTGYAEVLDDAGSSARQNEHAAFVRAITMLDSARTEGSRSRKAIEAFVFLNRLWSILMEDLASAENGLPAELRAGLLSTGIWVLKEIERLRNGETDDVSDLEDIHKIIVAGLA